MHKGEKWKKSARNSFCNPVTLITVFLLSVTRTRLCVPFVVNNLPFLEFASKGYLPDEYVMFLALGWRYGKILAPGVGSLSDA
jgi:hypothetical protein